MSTLLVGLLGVVAPSGVPAARRVVINGGDGACLAAGDRRLADLACGNLGTPVLEAVQAARKVRGSARNDRARLQNISAGNEQVPSWIVIKIH